MAVPESENCGNRFARLVAASAEAIAASAEAMRTSKPASQTRDTACARVSGSLKTRGPATAMPVVASARNAPSAKALRIRKFHRCGSDADGRAPASPAHRKIVECVVENRYDEEGQDGRDR